MFFSVALLLCVFPFPQSPSSSLPRWTPGTLDIHQISTREGNAALVVFPDGTTMLVDAGGARDGRAGAKIARYVQAARAPSAARLYPGPHDIFATLLQAPTNASIGARAEQLKADHGHIVLRVEPGGSRYRVFVLDETTEANAVLGVFGPYASR